MPRFLRHATERVLRYMLHRLAWMGEAAARRFVLGVAVLALCVSFASPPAAQAASGAPSGAQPSATHRAERSSIYIHGTLGQLAARGAQGRGARAGAAGISDLVPSFDCSDRGTDHSIKVHVNLSTVHASFKVDKRPLRATFKEA